MFSRIIFIDNTYIENLNHIDIKNRAIGASEYQFYSLLGEFSKLPLEIICYNNAFSNDELIGNVQYKNIQTMNSSWFLPTDKIIVQRYCSLLQPFLAKTNKVFLWFHDYVCDNVLNLPSYDCKQSLDIIYKHKNVHFIFNSITSKELYIKRFADYHVYFEPYRYEVIYNILYEDDFCEAKQDTIDVNKNAIVFGSAWCKGIHSIIQLFRHISAAKPEVKLILMSPGYDYPAWGKYSEEIVNEFKEKVVILGPQDKKSYCNVNKTSLCVLSAPFFETFGCIFAESYYLGTPVIADIHCGATKEIIEDEHFIVDYNNPDSVIARIEELQTTRDSTTFKLDEKFLVEENMLKWKNFVLF